MPHFSFKTPELHIPKPEQCPTGAPFCGKCDVLSRCLSVAEALAAELRSAIAIARRLAGGQRPAGQRPGRTAQPPDHDPVLRDHLGIDKPCE